MNVSHAISQPSVPRAPRTLLTIVITKYALPLNAFVWVLGLITWVIWANKHWNGLDENIIKNVIDSGNRDFKD